MTPEDIMLAAFEDELEKIAGQPRYIKNLAMAQRQARKAGKKVTPPQYLYTQSLVDRVNAKHGVEPLFARRASSDGELAVRSKKHLESLKETLGRFGQWGGWPNRHAPNRNVSERLFNARLNKRGKRWISPSSPIGFQGPHSTRDALQAQLKKRTAPRPAPTTAPQSFSGPVRTYVGG